MCDMYDFRQMPGGGEITMRRNVLAAKPPKAKRPAAKNPGAKCAATKCPVICSNIVICVLFR